MSTSLLKQFGKARKSGPIRVVWYDDHPEDVETLVDQLKERGFDAKLFGEPEDIIQHVNDAAQKKLPLRIPDVCITDLLIDKTKGTYADNYSGVQVRDNLDGAYARKLSVPARVGAASHVPEMIESLPEKLFCFKYLTSDLAPSSSRKFDQFTRDIERSAVSLWVDHWCVDFMNLMPVKEYSKGKRYKREKFLFGYIVRFAGLSSIVWLWNPQENASGKLCTVAKEFLKTRGIEEIQQPFRVVLFTDRKQPNAAIRVIEPVSEAASFQFEKAWPEFDASEFKGL